MSLGILHGPNKYYESFLEECLFGIIEYSYWNNTDKPNHIPKSEWDIRGVQWNTSLKSLPTNAYSLTANVTLPYKHITVNRIVHELKGY